MKISHNIWLNRSGLNSPFKHEQGEKKWQVKYSNKRRKEGNNAKDKEPRNK